MYKSCKNRTKRTKRTQKRKMKGGNVTNIISTEQGFDITYGRSIIHLPKLQDIKSMNTHVSPISIFRAVGLGCTSVDYTPFDDDQAKTTYKCIFFKYKCHPSYSGTLGNIVSSSVSKTPLKNDPFLFEFMNEIIERSKVSVVFVFGHSFGGLMINRIAEILIKIYRHMISHTGPTNNEIKEVLEKIFANLFFAGFGSVYIPEEVRQEDIPIKIINYTAIGDVSNTCTRGVCHIQRVNDTTSFTTIDRLYLSYKHREPSKGFHMVDLCFIDEQGKSTCTNRINSIPLARSSTEWSIHNRYDPLIDELLQKRTIDITEI